MAAFSDRLLSLRKQKGITQQELADILTRTGDVKITRSAVGMWESGQRIPKWEVLETIADYFNVDIQYLRGKDPVEATTAQQQREALFLELLRQLSPAQQEMILAQLQGAVHIQKGQGFL